MIQPVSEGFANIAPLGRNGHVAVSYEKYMLVWGGYRENPGASANTFFNGSEIWIYNYLSEKWRMKISYSPICPPGMSGSVAVVIDDALYLFGGYGYNGEGCTNCLYKLDLETIAWELLTPTGTPPLPVDKMVGWKHNKKFYIFGGFGHPTSTPFQDFQFVFYHLLWRGWTNQFFEYDPKENIWRRPNCYGPLPSARAAHAAAILNHKVYIFGGRHDVYRLNDLHCLDMESMQWSGEIPARGPIPEGRSWHSLTATSEQFLILYGGFSQNNIALSDCWMFDTGAGIWQPIELPFEKPRLWHSECLNIFNEVLIFGGCTSNILDLDRSPEHASDIVEIRLAPKALFRLCVDKLVEFSHLNLSWKCLPHSLQNLLSLRVGSSSSRHTEGS